MLDSDCPMPNIYDVARAARVSVATVSAAVNGTAFVSPALKGRVQRAVTKLGYQPNLVARSLATQQSRTIGMIVPDIANPFFPEVVRGAEDAAYDAGYMLLIASSDNDLSKEEVYLRLFVAKRVDGVIFTKAPGAMPKTLQTTLARAGVPLVLLARTVPGLRADIVEMDDKRATHEGVTHLLRLGYRRVGFITGLSGATTSRRRLDGYRAALRDWKQPIDPGADRPRRFPRRVGLSRGPRAAQATARRRVHLELPDERRLHGGAAAVPAALSGRRRDRHLRRPSVARFVLAAADHDRSAQARARRRRRAPAHRAARRSASRRATQTIRLPSAMRIRESCGCALRGRAALAR